MREARRRRGAGVRNRGGEASHPALSSADALRCWMARVGQAGAPRRRADEQPSRTAKVGLSAGVWTGAQGAIHPPWRMPPAGAGCAAACAPPPTVQPPHTPSFQSL
eukprot:350888-Chlamydomonas_euryale.AAC.5